MQRLIGLLLLGCSIVHSPCLAMEFSSTALHQHVARLADKSMLGRRAGTAFERRAVEYIVQQLKSMEVPTVKGSGRLQSVPVRRRNEDLESHNVIGVIYPDEQAELKEVIVLGAHLDHLGETSDGRFHPGADDNASGVAVTLEVAAALQQTAADLRRPVVVVFFGAEEVGLLGSREFVRKGPVPHERILAMVNIDMIGRPFMDQSNLKILKSVLKIDEEAGLGVVGTAGRPYFAKVVEAMGEKTGVRPYGSQAMLSPIIKRLARNRSDHSAFERVGIPSLFFSSGESDDYHRPSDSADKVSGERLSRRASFVFEVVRELATVAVEELPPRENVVIPEGKPVQERTLQHGALTVRFRDNSDSPKVLSGLQSLTHQATPEFDAFDPDQPGASAGLNFEHIISGHRRKTNAFTPRSGRYELFPLEDGRSVRLVRRREDSPWDVSSTLTYTIAAPHYVDFEFRCTPHNAQLFGKRRHVIFFFANYMNDVLDPSLHFRGQRGANEPETWVSSDAPPGHADWNQGGTFRHQAASPLEYDDNQQFRLNSWSYEEPRYTKPFYYGRAGNGMVLILMFDRASTKREEIRFSLFKFKLPKQPRPAWDFQYVVRQLIENREYGFRGRLVWKPWVSSEDCLDEYERWVAALKVGG